MLECMHLWIKANGDVIQAISSVIQALVVVVTIFLARTANALSKRILTSEVIEKCKEIRMGKALKTEQDNEIKRLTEVLLSKDQQKIVYTLFGIKGKE